MKKLAVEIVIPVKRMMRYFPPLFPPVAKYLNEKSLVNQ
jgi:hypothetical protein